MYLDTCIVAKLYLPEAESARVETLVRAEKVLVSSELALTEFASVLARKHREGILDGAEHDLAWSEFHTHCQEAIFSLFPVTRHTLMEAAELLRQVTPSIPLRTLDAIHLATCRQFQAYPLFTSDKVMLAACQALQIPVLTP